MVILGIDFGKKKIGVAKSDEDERIAVALEVISATSNDDIKNRINELIGEHQAGMIVVGVPTSFSRPTSTELVREVDLQNQQMRDVLSFVDWLKSVVSIPVEITDERFSTKIANRFGKELIGKHGADDAVAAMVILESYLDQRRVQRE